MIKIKFPSSKFKYMLKILNYDEEPKTLKSRPGRKLPALALDLWARLGSRGRPGLEFVDNQLTSRCDDGYVEIPTE